MKTSTRSGLALCASLLVGLSSTAFGAMHNEDTVVRKTVRFKDLDLSTTVGAQTLYERITSAARDVCSEQDYMFIRKCRARAVADAVAGVNNPLLSNVHRSRSGRVEEVARR
jgi:UrcA family protein